MKFVAPKISNRRLAVRLFTAGERQVRKRHPWVFDQSIESVSHEGAPGDLAVIFDKRREFLAVGLWDPLSPIRIRVIHVGRPRVIDAEFWHEQVTAALRRRDVLRDEHNTTGYRLIHGENDGFPGLVADLYDTTVVIKLYSSAWQPHLTDIVQALVELVGPEVVVIRLGRLAAAQELNGLVDGGTLVGCAPRSAVPFLENGLRFEADVVSGQKTGYFLDQRDNRSRVQQVASDANVLDVFSCTGGFGVYAAAGGARSVTSVDISAAALATARRHMDANATIKGRQRCRYEQVHDDAFSFLETAVASRHSYDIVVIDPPSFAGRQSSVPGALRSYQRLTTLGLKLVADDGMMVQASCSSRVSAEQFVGVVHKGASTAGFTLDDAVVTGHAVDHPIGFPQGEYLKAVFARPRRS